MTDDSEERGMTAEMIPPHTLTPALFLPFLFATLKSIMQLSGSKCSFLDVADARGQP